MLPREKDDKYLQILRKIPSYKKLASAFGLYDFARERVFSQLRLENPQLSDKELKEFVNKRFLGV